MNFWKIVTASLVAITIAWVCSSFLSWTHLYDPKESPKTELIEDSGKCKGKHKSDDKYCSGYRDEKFCGPGLCYWDGKEAEIINADTCSWEYAIKCLSSGADVLCISPENYMDIPEKCTKREVIKPMYPNGECLCHCLPVGGCDDPCCRWVSHD